MSAEEILPSRTIQEKDVEDEMHEEEDSVGFYRWIVNLGNTIGWRFLIILSVVQHLLKGFVNSFSGMSVSYIFALYNTPAPTVSIYRAVTQLPWSLKVLTGLCSDMLPIWGLHRAPYMIGSSILGTLAFLSIGIVPTALLPVQVVVVCLFMIQLQISTNDILTQAKYAEKIREFPRFGPSILSFVWFGGDVGSLVAAVLSGAVISAFGAKSVFVICSVPAFACIIPVMLNFLGENVKSDDEVVKRRDRFFAQPETLFLCMVIYAGAVAIMACGILIQDVTVNFTVTAIVFLGMLTMFSLFLSPSIAKFAAFALIQASLQAEVGAASFYFLTDTVEQYPEGPHFSPFFVNSVLGSAGAILSMVGVLTYAKFFSRYSYRNLILCANFASMVLEGLDSFFYSHLNRALGIPDHVFVLGNSVCKTVVEQWRFMPLVVILSYLCPKDMEATMYALLAACHNMGQTIALSSGAMLLHVLDVTPNGTAGESEKFKNLWLASLISSLLPLVPLLLTIKFVPDVSQGDRVLTTNADATSGSLWRHWTHVD